MVDSAPSPVSDSAPRLTWWIRSADVLIILLAVVALSAYIFGGFRLRFDEVRVAVSSPHRALAALLVVAVLRYAIERRQHLGIRLARGWRMWRADEAVHAATRMMLFVRFPVIAAAYLAVAILGYPGEKEPPFRASRNEFLNLPARWDAGWYLGIATDGYLPDRRAEVQQNIAFFPAYPMLMRIGGTLLGGRAQGDVPGSVNYVELTARLNERTLLAGWLISLAASFGAMVYLFRLARETLGGDAGEGSVLLIAAYPFAYFFGAVYTEGLFLLGTLAALYHFRRHELWRAAAWGLLVGLTRPNGCLLSVPLGVMAVQQAWLPGTLRAGDPASRPGWLSWVRATAAAAMPGIGMVLFSAWLWTITGLPLAWMQAHRAWGRTFHSVDTLLSDRMRTISEVGLYQYSRAEPVELVYVACLLTCLATAWPVARRLGWGYLVVILVTVLPPLSAGGFLSMGRITSTLFPVFLYLGWRLPPTLRTQVAMACLVLQGLFAAMFFTWRPVF